MSLTAGTATAGRIGVRSIGATATDATGGTGPYTYQWQFNWPRGGAAWSNATGLNITTRTATLRNLGPAARYRLRLQYTDAVAAVVYSNTLTVSTMPLRGSRLAVGMLRRDLQHAFKLGLQSHA